MVRNTRKLFSNQNNSSNISYEDLEELSSDYDFFNKDDIRELDNNINNINHRFDIASGDSQEVKQIMDAINSLEGYVKLINNSIHQNGHCDANVIKSIQIGTEALSSIIGIEPEDVVLSIESLEFIDNDFILTNEIKDELSSFITLLQRRLDSLFNQKLKGLKKELMDNKESPSLEKHVRGLLYIVKRFKERAIYLKNSIQEEKKDIEFISLGEDKLNLFRINGVINRGILDPVGVMENIERLTHNVLLNSDNNFWIKHYKNVLNEAKNLINKIDFDKKGKDGINQFFCILDELKNIALKPIPNNQDNKSNDVNVYLINDYLGVSTKFNNLSVCNEPLMSYYQSPEPVNDNAVMQLKSFIFEKQQYERYKSLIEYIDRFIEMLDYISTNGIFDSWEKSSKVFPIFNDYCEILENDPQSAFFDNSKVVQKTIQKAIELSVLTGDIEYIVNNLKFLFSTKILHCYNNEDEHTLGQYFLNLFDENSPEKDLPNRFLCYPFAWFIELTKTSGKFNTDMGRIHRDVDKDSGNILKYIYFEKYDYNINKLKFLFKNWELVAINNSMQAYNNLIYCFCNSFLNFIENGL